MSDSKNIWDIFDFSQFPKEMEKEEKVEMNVPPLAIKSESSVTSFDDAGNINDSPISEIITDQVNFVYTGKSRRLSDNFKDDGGIKNYHISDGTRGFRSANEEDVGYDLVRRPGERVVEEFNQVEIGPPGGKSKLYTVGRGESKDDEQTYDLQIIPQHYLLRKEAKRIEEKVAQNKSGKVESINNRIKNITPTDVLLRGQLRSKPKKPKPNDPKYRPRYKYVVRVAKPITFPALTQAIKRGSWLTGGYYYEELEDFGTIDTNFDNVEGTLSERYWISITGSVNPEINGKYAVSSYIDEYNFIIEAETKSTRNNQNCSSCDIPIKPIKHERKVNPRVFSFIAFGKDPEKKIWYTYDVLKDNENADFSYGRIRALHNPSITTSSAMVDREVYATCGLWPNNGWNIDSDIKKERAMGENDSSAKAFISRKDYEKRVKDLEERLTDFGIGIVVKPYLEPEESLETEEEDPLLNENFSYLLRYSISDSTRARYLSTLGDVRQSHINSAKKRTKWRLTKFKEAKKAASQFIKRKQVSIDRLLPLTEADITPFSVSIKEVARSLHDEENMLDNLSSAIRTLFRFANKVPGVSDGDIRDISLKTLTVTDEWERDSAGNFIYETITDKNGNEAQVKKPVFVRNESESEPSSFDYYMRKDEYKDKNFEKKEIHWEDPKDWKYYRQAITYEIIGGDKFGEMFEDIRKLRKNIWSRAFGIFTFGLSTFFAFFMIERQIDIIEDLLAEFKWYERYVQESLFSDRSFVTKKKERNYNSDKKFAKILIPVDDGRTGRRGSFWSSVKSAIKGGASGSLFGPVGIGISGVWGWRRRRRRRKYQDTYGINWYEISFIHTSPLYRYTQNDKPSAEVLDIGITVESLTRESPKSMSMKMVTSEDHGLEDRDVVLIEVANCADDLFNGQFYTNIEVVDSTTIKYDLRILPNSRDVNISPVEGSDIVLVSAVIPFEPTASREEIDIKAEFSMPHLPLRSDLLRFGLEKYGAIEQKGAGNDMYEYTNPNKLDDPIRVLYSSGMVDDEVDYPAGYEIFKDTSSNITDMRSGLDIYRKVQFLLRILKDEFKKERVDLVETVRSHPDQEDKHMGGEDSNFLSWHNYGLAVKILITTLVPDPEDLEGNSMIPVGIEEGSEAFFKLFEIAKNFIQGAKEGKFGTPCNVIWGAQIVVNPNLFEWEFLPIGVNHMDAWKFREAVFNQKDPVATNAYVNITEQNLISKVRNDTIPHVKKHSKAYNQAIIINGDRYVPPWKIRNYTVKPNDLVLKNVEEFFALVLRKKEAHGRTLNEDQTLTQWINANPISARQLFLYNCLQGNYDDAKVILALAYTNKYTVNKSMARQNPIKFVKDVLGEDEYNKIKIHTSVNTNNAYLELSTGKIAINILEVRSTHPGGNKNMFGSQRIDPSSAEFGRYIDGVWETEEDLNNLILNPDESQRGVTIASASPIISGYVPEGQTYIVEEGNTESDGYNLHLVVADRIIEELDAIRALYEGKTIEVMHDELSKSPALENFAFLENEFGVILAQSLSGFERSAGDDDVRIPASALGREDPIEPGSDVISLDALEQIYKQIEIENTGEPNILLDDEGIVPGSQRPFEEDDRDKNRNQSVFEKLISTHQLTGVQQAKPSNEKPVVVEPLGGENTIENLLRKIRTNNDPDVRDIL